MSARPIVLAMTGASGAAYGMRLLECLLEAGREVDFLISEAGRMVVEMELGLSLAARPVAMREQLIARYPAASERLRIFGRQDWMAPFASGSGVPPAMVICPCTTGTLASIAQGMSDHLIERAADVVLKEGRRLILVPREMPLSAIHLEHMLKLARLGVVIMPPMPGFYHQPQGVNDLVDFVVARILDQLDVPHALGKRWGG
jgi:4-hydroxy-3-polyprenylbenzoate decarboxylase